MSRTTPKPTPAMLIAAINGTAGVDRELTAITWEIGNGRCTCVDGEPACLVCRASLAIGRLAAGLANGVLPE